MGDWRQERKYGENLIEEIEENENEEIEEIEIDRVEVPREGRK